MVKNLTFVFFESIDSRLHIAEKSLNGPFNCEIHTSKPFVLLMDSNEAQQIFKEKYKKSDRQILTKMAGRKVRKASNLRCITTTSTVSYTHLTLPTNA